MTIDKRICLNGWWDFLPLDKDASTPDTVPEEGWLCGRYLVPSFWTKLPDAVRTPGAKYFTDRKELFKTPGDVTPQTEFLFDAFGYPNEWSLSRRAWARRTFCRTRIRSNPMRRSAIPRKQANVPATPPMPPVSTWAVQRATPS